MSREQLKFVVVGSVDHGKSTLIGRFLYDTGSLPPAQLETIRQVCNSDEQVEFAFVLDHLEEERNRRITIDTAQTFFRSPTRDYVIIDAPGHKEFLKNMITGASQASAALLMLDVHEGLREQTRRHAYMLSLLGIRQLLIVLNKMDKVGYDEAVFSEKAVEIKSVLAKVQMDHLAVIPAAAMTGENVVHRSQNMAWYSGPTVLEALDLLKATVTDEKLPLRFPVQDVYELDGQHLAVGRVASGSIRRGDKVCICPLGTVATVETIQKFEEELDTAQAGDSIGMTLAGDGAVKRGNTLCTPGVLPQAGSDLGAKVFWMSPRPMKKGESLVLRLATQEIPCTVKSINNRIDAANLEVVEQDAAELSDTEIAELSLATSQPVHWDSFTSIAEMGRLVLMRGDSIVAGGIIV